MQKINVPSSPIDALNFIQGKWTAPSKPNLEVLSPYTGGVIGHTLNTDGSALDTAVQTANQAALEWGQTPIKERSSIMFKFREILLRDIDSISHLISSESGKLHSEAKAGLLKGIEVLEFALSLQNLDRGGKMQVSRGVFCEYRREPLGVVAGITPFNFPAMVPMWMMPIAITLGNAFIWKPSDKTPLTSTRIANAFQEAGLPDGVLTIVQGGKETVEGLCDHPGVKAIGFVGSTPVARSVYLRATSHGKRCLALGGAKNHIILMPDADAEMAASGIFSSFTGCAGQRCMASSVLVAVGETNKVIEKIVEKAKTLKLGPDMGAIITKESRDRLSDAIGKAESEGIKVLADGRKTEVSGEYKQGYWLSPTVLDNVSPNSFAAKEELFGPVLSVVHCKTLSEALEIENKNPFGNAASVFTSRGDVAEEVAKRAKVGMVGVNIGVPVPREPFSFGGVLDSKFGQGDITGEGSLDLWSNQKKVTMKWSLQKDQNWMS